MAQSIRVSDEMYALAQKTGAALDRSLAQQFEYWARLGAAIDAAGITSSQAIELLDSGNLLRELMAVAAGQSSSIGLQRIRSRNERVEADVAAGKRSARSLLIFSADAVQSSSIEKAPYASQIPLEGGEEW